LSYYSHELPKVGVKIILEKEVTVEFIEQMKFQAVVVATGSLPKLPEIPGIWQKNVSMAVDVLAGKVEVGGEKVVMIGGGQVGIETAEFLVQKGKKVSIVEMLDGVGKDIGPSTRWGVLSRIYRQGIKIYTNSKVEEIRDGGVIAIDHQGNIIVFEADNIVVSVGSRSDVRLLQQLNRMKDKIDVYAIGDCVEPRTMFEAIHGGASIARKI
jgi:pyruvate/2-oxoglutarate dehydrogenase complex dihydrolipoamide dehydrogenase (E3) component